MRKSPTRSIETSPAMHGMGTEPTGLTFRKRDHLSVSNEIRSVMQKGQSVSVFGMKLFYRKNEQSISRAAFVLKKKYGTSVERNRVKRLMRESFRLRKRMLIPGFDLVFLAFPGKDQFFERDGQVSRLCKSAGLVLKL